MITLKLHFRVEEVVDEIWPSLDWAASNGLLDEEQLIEILTEEIVNSLVIEEVDGGEN